MKKDLGIKPYLFPMPVVMVSTYCEDGSVDVMAMAWGTICDDDIVLLNLSESHKTSENIKRRKAFTLAIADLPHMAQADFFGWASANTMPDKFARTGFTARRSGKVDAPIIDEFPLTLECEAIETRNESFGFCVIGKIVGTLADEDVLDGKGNVDPSKLNALIFDQMRLGYYAVGEKCGQAWQEGKALMDGKSE